MIQRIRELKKQHYQQFNEVDLILETTPRDSRYSTQLVELMRNEETALAQDSQSSVALSLIQRVENSLSNETKGFFQNVVKHNAKKLSMLRENYTQDRQRIKMDFNRGMNTQNSNLSHNTLLHNNTSGNNHNSSAIEREEERLLADYYNNWKQYESLHLQEAFQAQGCKIDNEWGKQEQSLKEEYYTKKAGLLGTTPHALMANTNETTANNSSNTMNRQFHNAEKQKTLIHTAPVFSPTRAVMKPSNKNQLEVSSIHNLHNIHNIHNIDTICYHILSLFHSLVTTIRTILSRKFTFYE